MLFLLITSTLVGRHFGVEVGGQESVQCMLCMKKSIYESSLSVIIVHNSDCIKSRVPAEVVSYSSENLWNSAGNH